MAYNTLPDPRDTADFKDAARAVEDPMPPPQSEAFSFSQSEASSQSEAFSFADTGLPGPAADEFLSVLGWHGLPSVSAADLVAIGAALLVAAVGAVLLGRKRRDGGGTKSARWPLVFLTVLLLALGLELLVATVAGWPAAALRTALVLAMAGWASIWIGREIQTPALRRGLVALVWVVAFIFATGLKAPVTASLDAVAFSVGTVRLSLLLIAKALVLLAAALFVALWISNLIDRWIGKTGAIDPSMRVFLGKVARIAIVALMGLVIIDSLGIDLTAFAVFSGALGIGIGFGLQKIVSNLIAGLILLLDRSLKPGDVIEIETASGSTYGWVQNMAARYTSIVTRDGTETLIPNETLIINPVTNWTHTNRLVRIKLPVGIAYNSDVEAAMKLCVEAAEAGERVVSEPKPICLVSGFGDSSVDLEVRFWIGDPEAGLRNISSQIYLEIWKRFHANGIEIPFPQRDLHIRSSVPLEFGAHRGSPGRDPDPS